MKKLLLAVALSAFAAVGLSQAPSSVAKVSEEKNGSDLVIGTVTSVDCTSAQASLLTCGGGPISTAGMLTISWPTQTANTLLSGPASGAAAIPTFRAMVAADVKAVSPTKIDGTTTPVSITDATQTTIGSCTIPGGTIGTNGHIVMDITSDWIQNSATTATATGVVLVTFGGTTMYSTVTASITVAQSTTPRAVNIHVEVWGIGATNTQRVKGWWGIGPLLTSGTNDNPTNTVPAPIRIFDTAAAKDTTAQQILLVKWTNNAATGDTFTAYASQCYLFP